MTGSLLDVATTDAFTASARPTPPAQPLRVALAGCGTVGSALVDLLQARAPHLAAAHDVAIELTSVLVRRHDRPRPGNLPRALITTDVDAFLRAPADVVVEAVGGDDVATRIVEDALRRGRRVVTANKLLVARRGPALVRLARAHGTSIEFEASVAGAVPVVRSIREQLGPSGVRAVRGIVNGTTNFILDAMSSGSTFAAALRAAQELGYAETDPSRDLSGADAEDKLRILGWLAFGVDPAGIEVQVRGIGPGVEDLVASARRTGCAVRLIATIEQDGDALRAAVTPRAVPRTSAFAAVRRAGNLIEVETAWGGTLHWAGPGAGGAATASAILGDVVRARPLSGTSSRTA